MTRQRPDYVLFALILALSTIGLVVVYSASYPRAAARSAEQLQLDTLGENRDETAAAFTMQTIWRQINFVGKHAVFGFAGLIAMLLICYANPRVLRAPRLANLLVGVTVVLLFLTYTSLGSASDTFAHRWLSLGPLTIQPSEFAKITLALYLASFFARADARLHDWSCLAKPLAVVGLVLLLVLKQPHLGGVIMLVGITAVMAYVAGLPLDKWLVLFLVGLSGLGYTLYEKPYQLERLQSFIDPLAHAEDSGLQIIRAGTALARGGLSGRGMGRSIEKFDWLPECHSDSIFAVLGEEFGLLGTATVLLLFMALGLRGLTIASRRTDAWGRLLAVGATASLVGQGLLNMGVTSGSLPQTGVGLPFISYGGTSLVVSLATVGVLLHLSREQAVPRVAEKPRV